MAHRRLGTRDHRQCLHDLAHFFAGTIGSRQVPALDLPQAAHPLDGEVGGRPGGQVEGAGETLLVVEGGPDPLPVGCMRGLRQHQDRQAAPFQVTGLVEHVAHGLERYIGGDATDLGIGRARDLQVGRLVQAVIAVTEQGYERGEALPVACLHGCPGAGVLDDEAHDALVVGIGDTQRRPATARFGARQQHVTCRKLCQHPSVRAGQEGVDRCRARIALQDLHGGVVEGPLRVLARQDQRIGLQQPVGEGLDRHRDADLAGVGGLDEQAGQERQSGQPGAVPPRRPDHGAHSIITVRWMVQ